MVWHGMQWPHDLSIVSGLWQYPLTFTFFVLTILNLQVHDASLWLILILVAMDPAAPLHRVLITQCAG